MENSAACVARIRAGLAPLSAPFGSAEKCLIVPLSSSPPNWIEVGGMKNDDRTRLSVCLSLCLSVCLSVCSSREGCFAEYAVRPGRSSEGRKLDFGSVVLIIAHHFITYEGVL